jgi:hypothetical protein|uniref:Rho termination factor-like N-terminal domain-containing protein n=1 Tax=viral metagenome TaxID=1070528 RepID=A0A6C0BG44_9ZZZZ
MSYLSDTLTIGVLLVLLFGSISLYLYTRIQQAEQKIHLLESILLDLKMSAEIKSYTELPADDSHETPNFKSTTAHDNYVALDDVELPITEYTSLDDSEPVTEDTVITLDESMDTSEDETASTVNNAEKDTVVPSVIYDSMTLKELQALAKSRGITGAGSMKKGPIIEALKTSDRIVKPGSTGTGSNSFLETSALVSNESE